MNCKLKARVSRYRLDQHRYLVRAVCRHVYAFEYPTVVKARARCTVLVESTYVRYALYPKMWKLKVGRARAKRGPHLATLGALVSLS